MNRKTLIIILVVVGAICLCSVCAVVVLITQAGRLIGQSWTAHSPAQAGGERSASVLRLSPLLMQEAAGFGIPDTGARVRGC